MKNDCLCFPSRCKDKDKLTFGNLFSQRLLVCYDRILSFCDPSFNVYSLSEPVGCLFSATGSSLVGFVTRPFHTMQGTR